MSYAEPCPGGCAAGCETCGRRTMTTGKITVRIKGGDFVRKAVREVQAEIVDKVRREVRRASRRAFGRGV